MLMQIKMTQLIYLPNNRLTVYTPPHGWHINFKNERVSATNLLNK